MDEQRRAAGANPNPNPNPNPIPNPNPNPNPHPHPALFASAQDFAADAALFRSEYRAAWTKLMNADRFDGPARNLCDGPPIGPLSRPASPQPPCQPADAEQVEEWAVA